MCDVIKNAFESSSIRAIADAMNISEKMLGEIHEVLKMYFTISVTKATAEIIFVITQT